MAKYIDLAGQKIGRWLVLHRENGNWRCQCDCGTQRVVLAQGLRERRSLSCGCYATDLKKRPGGPTHKYSEYGPWQEMRRRCLSEKNHAYGRYGGRDIKICDRWSSGEHGKSGFECFLEDMGPRPDKTYSLDRIDNYGNYEPKNCRWATPKQQALNTRRVVKIIHFGKKITADEFAALAKVDANSLRRRMRIHGEFAQLAAAKLRRFLPVRI